MEINFEVVAFGIIQEAAQAKAKAIEAVEAANQNNFDLAKKLMEEAEVHIGEANKKHFDVIVAEANGEKLNLTVLFMHAEDQLLTIQTLLLVSGQLILLHKKIGEK